MAELSLTRARTIIRKALAKGREEGFKPLSVVVLDTGGHVKGLRARRRGLAGPLRHRPGQGLWRDHAGHGGPRTMARAEQQAYFMAAMNGVYGGQVVPVPGGVLVRDKRGTILGAVGVTGDTSDNDVIAAVAGIEAVGLTLSED